MDKPWQARSYRWAPEWLESISKHIYCNYNSERKHVTIVFVNSKAILKSFRLICQILCGHAAKYGNSLSPLRTA